MHDIEAYMKVIKFTKNSKKIIKCMEYKTLFVFQTVPMNFVNLHSADELFDTLISVNKQTGEIRNFKPFDIPFDEYINGKEIQIR